MKFKQFGKTFDTNDTNLKEKLEQAKAEALKQRKEVK